MQLYPNNGLQLQDFLARLFQNTALTIIAIVPDSVLHLSFSVAYYPSFKQKAGNYCPVGIGAGLGEHSYYSSAPIINVQ